MTARRSRRGSTRNPPLGERLEVVAQVADALDTVHAAGIYHRDIKPANILLTRREDGALRGKLTDFGLGAAQDPDLLRSIYASRVEGLSGTWDYIAPELRHGGTASAQSDIYSLGLTLYQVVVGDLERPLTGDWERQLPSDVLCADIRRCVSQSPADRWRRPRICAGPAQPRTPVAAARTGTGPRGSSASANSPLSTGRLAGLRHRRDDAGPGGRGGPTSGSRRRGSAIGRWPKNDLRCWRSAS